MSFKNTTYRAKLLVNQTKASIPYSLHSQIHKSFLKAIDNNSPTSTFSIAISGGSLPSFLSTLPQSFIDAEIDPQWGRWHVVLADERLVPSTDEDSNLRAIRNHFLDKVPIPNDQIHGIDESFLLPSTLEVPSKIAEQVAAEYQDRVIDPLVAAPYAGTDRNSMKQVPVLDCVLLGFGPDGHTCSLFPTHPLLDIDNLLVAGIEDSPKAPPRRITLTLPMLNDFSRDVVFVGAGGSKGPVLDATFKSVTGSSERSNSDSGGDGEDCLEYVVTMADSPIYPCGMVRPKKGTLTWVVDADATHDLLVTHGCVSSML